jgi:hypothetical protein
VETNPPRNGQPETHRNDGPGRAPPGALFGWVRGRPSAGPEACEGERAVGRRDRLLRLLRLPAASPAGAGAGVSRSRRTWAWRSGAAVRELTTWPASEHAGAAAGSMPWRERDVAKDSASRSRKGIPPSDTAKRQQMQWTRKGAHLLLQTRSWVLDERLEETFRKWYPGVPTGPTCAREEGRLITRIFMLSQATQWRTDAARVFRLSTTSAANCWIGSSLLFRIC